ncbi:MAG: hypothetical protein QME94_06850 [Anaerolineae bacterium]|nr:hypothetical protein [Anaerolineae bacterium]
MVEQTCAPVDRVDVDRLYVEGQRPESWFELQMRAVELLEEGLMSEGQSRVLVHALQTLDRRGEAVPADSGDLYRQMRPILERLPCPQA